MNNIPKIIELYPDELLYSWIFRLARANGLSISVFSEAYLGISNAKFDSMSLDVRNEFVSLYKSLYTSKNMKELYISSTTYKFESLFMTRGQQTRYLNNVFRERSKLNTPVNTLLHNIKICSDCINEDIKTYGTPYLHRAHQLSGVCTCYKHKTKLMFYTKNAHSCDFDFSDYVDLDINVSNINRQYTQYVQTIFEADVHGSIHDIKSIIFDKISELGYSSKNDYCVLKDAFTNCDYSTLCSGDLGHFLKVKMIAATNVSALEVVPLLMFLFPDVNVLIKKLKDTQPNIELYQCLDCEQYYCSTQEAYDNGWGCPYCSDDLDSDGKFKSLVKTTNSDYQVNSEFESLDKYVSMHHICCNNDLKIRPRSYLYDGVRCTCESKITWQKAKNNIESNKGYKMLQFTNCNEPVTILCEECGHTFTCNYNKFIASPGCRICRPKIMTKELYEEHVYGLVGPEYTVVVGFLNQDEKVVIRHNKCGREQAYLPHHFLEGQRCKYCHNLEEDSSWIKGYQLLLQYNDEYGNILISKNVIYSGYNLGYWCQRQRDNMKKGTLNEICIKKLDDLGFCWNPLEHEWIRRYEQYKRYIEINGTASISRRTDFEGEHLGAWVETQRKNYKNSKMLLIRKEQLVKIGVII